MKIHDLSTQKGRNAYVKAMEKQGKTQLKVKIPTKIENYKISIEVRDSEGKVINDSEGVKQLALSYDVEMLPSNMEFNLNQLARTLKAFMPDRQINIEVYIKNSISGTYMNMFSFYVDEKRFVKH
jgi:hypothetical protein